MAEVVFENQTIIPGNLAISKQGDIYISINPLLNPSTKLYKVTNKSRSTVAREVKKLKENGVISRVGSDKSGYWQIIEPSLVMEEWV